MHANHGKTLGSTILLSIVAAALAGMVGTLGLIRQIGDLHPKVGDIIVFEPLEPVSRDLRARLPAIAADDTPGAACVLDVRLMHTLGGSLVIERRDPAGRYRYRVHWAGARTSNDGASCGESADLLLTPDALDMLALAAGGFGVPPFRRHTPLMRAGPAAGN